MGSRWFIERSGEREGPLTGAQLRGLAKSGYIGPESLVWREGLPEWIKASRVPGLFSGDSGGGAPVESEGSGSDHGGEGRPGAGPKGMRPELRRLPIEGGSAVAAGGDGRADRRPAVRSIADRILFGGFAIGRWISIIVVLGAMLVIAAGSLSYSASLVPVPAAELPSAESPRASIFASECLERRERERREAEAAAARRSPPRTGPTQPIFTQRSGMLGPNQCDPYRVQIRDIFAYLRMDNSSGELEARLCEIALDLAEDDRPWFLDGFLEFAKAWSRSPEASASGCDGGDAADWFVAEARSALRNRDDIHRQRLAERDEAESQRLARRQTAVQLLGGGVASLLVFLILPLLIQIERNTRLAS